MTCPLVWSVPRRHRKARRLTHHPPEPGLLHTPTGRLHVKDSMRTTEIRLWRATFSETTPLACSHRIWSGQVRASTRDLFHWDRTPPIRVSWAVSSNLNQASWMAVRPRGGPTAEVAGHAAQ